MYVKSRLTELLKDKGWTQTQLSEASGVPQGSISRFSKNSRYEIAHLFAIARALEVSVEELFDIEETNE